MNVHSFSSMVSWFNEVHIKAVKSIEFASLVKVNLKCIPKNFLNGW